MGNSGTHGMKRRSKDTLKKVGERQGKRVQALADCSGCPLTRESYLCARLENKTDLSPLTVRVSRFCCRLFFANV